MQRIVFQRNLLREKYRKMTATCNLHTEEKRQLNTEWQKQEKLWGDLNYCCLSMYAVCSMIPFNCYHCHYRVGMPSQ